MHPYRGILHKYRRLDGLSTRPYDQNTLTHQSTDTNDAPRDPPPRPRYMKSCPDTALLYATALSTSTAISTTPCISAAAMITASTAPLRQDIAHRHISYPTLSPSSASAVSLVTVFNLIWLTIFGLIRLNYGFNLIRLTCLFDSIRLTSNVFIFDPSHKILITPQSGFTESHIGQGVFEIFQH